MKLFLISLSFLSLTIGVHAKSKRIDYSKKKLNGDEVKAILLPKFERNYKDKGRILKLRKEVLSYGGKAIPSLIDVMKNGKYPDKNRWVATFLVGRIMGVKSAPFLSKFLEHPSWIMRTASLKTLLALKQKKYDKLFAKALKDNSMIVRAQALENIRHLNLSHLGPRVWAMLYDKKNYYQAKKGQKRGDLIKKVIKTVGDLNFKKAKTPLLKMIQKEKYSDIYTEIIYSLEKITGEDTPKGNMKVKRHFWQRYAMADAQI